MSHASLIGLSLMVTLLALTMFTSPSHATEDDPKPSQNASPIYPLKAQTLAGKTITLGETYRGRVMLVVNVASRCGFTRQYAGLQQLHEELAGEGLAILGFPCNQFGGQEPGTAEEIRDFCDSTYGVAFDLFARIDVQGDQAHPLYRYLTGETAPIEDQGPVKWNFEKFLIDHNGQLLARYRSRVTPDQMRADIEKALAALPRQAPTAPAP